MRGIVLGMACLVAVSACTSSADGSAGGSDPQRLSPRPPIDLDVSKFAQQPCAMLDAKRPVSGDVFAGTANGSTCTWRGKKEQYPSYSATVEPVSSGLEALFRRRAEFRMFEPTVITGFPAVLLDRERVTADRGQCTVAVGVADDAAITVTSTATDPKSSDYAAPCTDADLFAHALIGSIKAGNV